MQNKGCFIGTVAFAVFVGFAMTPFGCGVVWNLGNKPGFQGDMSGILQAQGVDLKDANCSMVRMSRQGNCDFTATRSDIDKLVKGIPLKRLPEYADRFKTPDEVHRRVEWVGSILRDPNSQLASDYLAGKPIECYCTMTYRPKSLSTPIKPSGFDYLVIYFEPQTNRASAFICYGYG